MAWQLTGDVGAYLAAAGGFLRANAVRNTIMLSVAETLQAQGPAVFGDGTPCSAGGLGQTARCARRSCTRRRTRYS